MEIVRRMSWKSWNTARGLLCFWNVLHRVPKKGSHQTFANNFLKS